MARRYLWRVLTMLAVSSLILAGSSCGWRAAAPPGPPGRPWLALFTSPSATATPTLTPTLTPSATPSPTPSPTPTIPPTATPSPAPDPVETLLRRLTLEDRVGQLLMAGIPGQAMSEAARHVVVDLRAGGIVFVASNGESPQQMQALTAGLQALAAGRPVPVPLFISINHEGGSVQHIRTGMTAFPSAMALGATGQPRLAYEASFDMAEELRAIGVNMNLAPDLDVNTEPLNPIIGLRSFGARPELVAECGVEFMHGTQAAGVIPVAKHFPGHGGVAADSHRTLPVVTASQDELWAVDLLPFRRAIAEGADVIMSAHLAVQALGQGDVPATLSHAIMTDLLRGSLGFRGLIVTDDLGMKGITGRVSQSEAAVRAVEAGADVVLSVGPPEAQDAIYAALLQAVRSGRIAPARLDDSVRRILALKMRYGLFQPAQAQSLAGVGSAEHQELARRASEAAVTPVDAGGLPLAGGLRTLVISPQGLPAGPAGDGWTLFGDEIRRRSSSCLELRYNPDLPLDVGALLAQAGPFDQAVVGLWDAAQAKAVRGDDTPFRLLQKLQATGKPVVAVAFELPYDLADVPEGVGAVATYGRTRPQVEQAAKVLFGEQEALGTLPVDLR